MSIINIQLGPANLNEVIAHHRRTRYVAEAPRTIACRGCGAARDRDCRSKRNAAYTVPFHAERKTDVARLTDDQKIAAVAALRDEQEHTRAGAR
jgi:hypothetical protein